MPSLTDEQKAKAVAMVSTFTHHTALLNMSVESVKGDELTLRLPYNEQLVGNPETGVLHGGAITVLLDQTMGVSAICSDKAEPSFAPTLDLRIDHLGAAPAGKDVFATARVYRATSKVLFVEGYAWHEKPEEPIARGTGTWVRVSPLDVNWLLEHEPGEKWG